MKKIMKGLAVVLLLATSAISQATPLLFTDTSGKLIGASGVDVAGSLYDVEFLDGSCFSLFNGCAVASDFTFQTEAAALEASEALQLQVFLGIYDAPDSISGCDLNYSCAVITVFDVTPPPFAGNVTGAVVDKYSSGFGYGTTHFSYSRDTTDRLELTFARWSVSAPSSVPEPSVILLMASSLFGFGLTKKKRRL